MDIAVGHSKHQLAAPNQFSTWNWQVLVHMPKRWQEISICNCYEMHTSSYKHIHMYTHSNTWTLQLAAPITSWPLQTHSPLEIAKFYFTCLEDDKKHEVTPVMTCTLLVAHIYTCTHTQTHGHCSWPLQLTVGCSKPILHLKLASFTSHA